MDILLHASVKGISTAMIPREASKATEKLFDELDASMAIKLRNPWRESTTVVEV